VRERDAGLKGWKQRGVPRRKDLRGGEKQKNKKKRPTNTKTPTLGWRV